MTWRVICADVLEGLAQLPSGSVQTVVTSPPYFGLRDYGTAEWDGGDAACSHSRHIDYGKKSDTNGGQIRGGPYRDVCGKCGATRVDQQIGLEPTPEAYVERIVEVFREVRRVLRDDGCVWLNLGDSYVSTAPGTRNSPAVLTGSGAQERAQMRPAVPSGLKPKDLVGIPWRVAFALQADGWYLRSAITWCKPSAMPESVRDRPTKATEMVFLLSKNARYYFDADAVRSDSGANLRDYWVINTEPFSQSHFATFPKKLVEPCVKAGTSERGCCGECGQPFERVEESTANGDRHISPKDTASHVAREGGGFDTSRLHSQYFEYERRTIGWATSCGHTGEPVPCTVLDPFCGSGTVGLVSLRLGRAFVGIELNPAYAQMARHRITDDAPLFNVQQEAR